LHPGPGVYAGPGNNLGLDTAAAAVANVKLDNTRPVVHVIVPIFFSLALVQRLSGLIAVAQ